MGRGDRYLTGTPTTTVPALPWKTKVSTYCAKCDRYLGKADEGTSPSSECRYCSEET